MSSQFSKESKDALKALYYYLKQSQNINKHKIRSISLDNPYIKDLYKKAYRNLTMIKARQDYNNHSKKKCMTYESYEGKERRLRDASKQQVRLTQNIMRKTGKTAEELLSCTLKPKASVRISNNSKMLNDKHAQPVTVRQVNKKSLVAKNPIRFKYHEMTDEDRLRLQNVWKNKPKHKPKNLPRAILKKSTDEVKTWLMG